MNYDRHHRRCRQRVDQNQIEYRSAGIIPLRRNPDTKRVEVLLIEEKKHPGQLNFIGGRKENCDNDNPLSTARREFDEETNSLASTDMLELSNASMDKQYAKFYNIIGKMFLFVIFVESRNKTLWNLPEIWDAADTAGSTTDKIRWVPLDALYENKDNKLSQRLYRCMPDRLVHFAKTK